MGQYHGIVHLPPSDCAARAALNTCVEFYRSRTADRATFNIPSYDYRYVDYAHRISICSQPFHHRAFIYQGETLNFLRLVSTRLHTNCCDAPSNFSRVTIINQLS